MLETKNTFFGGLTVRIVEVEGDWILCLKQVYLHRRLCFMLHAIIGWNSL